MNINGNFSSIEQITGAYLNNKVQKNVIESRGSDNSFQKILQQKATQGLKFSKHAGERLEERNITLSIEQMKRLEEATVRADEKGIKESLMLMDNMAFIVNVKNSTVITAMDQTDNKDNIFTNIDGAVIV
ncbi:TIGR02530 family flagellar biosynthesis protein [Bovifimicola ammoniilytica]|uniref:TIGR02530 family flagellar biosynthesis protein n=1 Tax=Bovifimicola ammoniilytica TaxID=2981720 RepID=UPI00033605CD|nr:TIGR02530 family flagellar biosynthesis protein [Bovifimicola ammoniilytica]MCU6753208.1 flagellar protein [Bovifimicola ammoniilytica]CCZ05317.1 flagellar operon protein [Eubacterium sp. CAG:603]SCJ57047.1 flagellar operon protein [uncultured Eubacterium sp.]